MRGDTQCPQLGEEVGHFIGLVRRQRDPVTAVHALQHGQRGLALGSAGGVSEHGIDDQAVAVLH